MGDAIKNVTCSNKKTTVVIRQQRKAPNIIVYIEASKNKGSESIIRYRYRIVAKRREVRKSRGLVGSRKRKNLRYCDRISWCKTGVSQVVERLLSYSRNRLLMMV